MDGIPPSLPTDSEDIAWALETAEALWRRGERVDAVVWVRRAAQAAGEGEDAKRAATLARYAAELGDWIGSHTMAGESVETHAQNDHDIDALLGGQENSDALSLSDIEVVSAHEFESGFKNDDSATDVDHLVAGGGARDLQPSDSEIMTVSLQAGDVEIVDEDDGPGRSAHEEFPEEEPTPAVPPPRSPVPNVPSAAEAHAGMLDPWADERRSTANARLSPRGFDEDEVITSAGQKTSEPPPRREGLGEAIPRAPKAPRLQAPPPPPAPRPRAPAPAVEEQDAESTTYRQISPRSPRGAMSGRPGTEQVSAAPAPPERKLSPPVRPPIAAPRQGGSSAAHRAAPLDKPAFSSPPRPPIPPRPPTAAPVAPRKPTAPPPKENSFPPPLDLLEMADSVDFAADIARIASEPPGPMTTTERPKSEPARARSEPAKAHSIPASARPTAPPPGSMPRDAFPSVVTVPPAAAAKPLLDLSDVEALSDLPDDARDAFAAAATTHTIATDEEVSHFALALVVEGEIDVSATIVDAPALRLERNSILRSRGSIVPGVDLRLVCASSMAVVATWDDEAVAAAFRTCPWVEEDLRAVTDRVQAKAGVTMGPLGERFDQSLRDHLTSKLTVRSLAPGEILVAQGKPAPIAIVGIGEVVVAKEGTRGQALRPGDFVFPSETLTHAAAPGTAVAGAAGAVVLFGDRSVAQELLMGFPPLLELLATM